MNLSIVFKCVFPVFLVFLLMSSTDLHAQSESDKETNEKKEHRVNEDVRNSVVDSLIVPEEEKVYKVVESMPRFPGCEEMEVNLQEKEKCAKKKMLQYLYSNLRYPSEAIKNGIDGMVVIKFMVNKNGRIENASVLRDIGYGCGEAALGVINSMNQMEEAWIPGKIYGENVNVMYSLPVKFKLHKTKEKEE